jgi:hypothetical protein
LAHYNVLDLVRFGILIAIAYAAHWLLVQHFGLESDRAWNLTFAAGLILVGLAFVIKRDIPVEFGDRQVGLLRGRDAIIIGVIVILLGSVMIVQTLRP